MGRAVLIAAGIGAALLVAGRAQAAGLAEIVGDETEPQTNRRGAKMGGYPATRVNWAKVRHFLPEEFRGELSAIDGRLIYAVDELRARLGAALIVSPARGSMTRFGDAARTSMHYANPAAGIYGQAVDLMSPEATLREVYEAAAAVREIGGIGIYPNWRPWPGVHVDIRARGTGGRLATWMGIGTPQRYAVLDWEQIAA